MAIGVGDRLPEATFLRVGDAGPEEVTTADLTAGRRIVLIGMPGAFTSTCTEEHMPSFVRTAEAFRGKGIDGIVCVVVNDPFVAKAWAGMSGAEGAGIEVVTDPSGAYVKAIGLDFDAPGAGFYGRAVRHAMVVRDGEVEVIQVEEGRGTCEMTAGETLLEKV